MNGWTLKNDDSGDTFTFSGFTLNAGATVRVWTTSGSNSASNLYWGQNQPVWDNGGDCATLRNNQGQVVNQYCY